VFAHDLTFLLISSYLISLGGKGKFVRQSEFMSIEHTCHTMFVYSTVTCVLGSPMVNKRHFNLDWVAAVGRRSNLM
jgi:hypothetical protein